MMISQIARASLRSEILIDFDCYVDTDIGLIRLIKERYLDVKVFNKDLLDSNMINIIKLLYNRKDRNPLYLFANEGVSKNDLDDYYKEFLEVEYDGILKYSVTTEIKSLINLFRTEPSIHVTFLCKNQKEKNLLVKDPSLQGYSFILENDQRVDFSKFYSFYFKYLDERIDKYIYPYKTYYFSKYKINFTDDFRLLDDNMVDKIMYNHGEIEIMDLYNMELIEGDQDNEYHELD